jgi:hypothetical protein
MAGKRVFTEDDVLIHSHDETYPGIRGWWAGSFPGRKFNDDWEAAAASEEDGGDCFTRTITVGGAVYRVTSSIDGYSVNKMSELLFDQGMAIKQAKAEGFKVVRGRPTRLVLDLDSDSDLHFYRTIFPRMVEEIKKRRGIDMTVIEEWKSKSGGYHVTIKLSKPLPIKTRLLIQACLGSDRLKEWLSLCRYWAGKPEPSMLFRPPDKHKNYDAYQERVSITDDDILF